MSQGKNREKNGVVSLIVCLFIMIIVTLVALSFAAIMRREQRQALERQLNSQAFYAAESGINDAIAALDTNAAAVGNITSCTDGEQDKINPNRVIDAGASVEYTCVFVDQQPVELNYDVSNRSARTVALNAATAISYIKISWQDLSPPATPTFSPNLSASGNFPQTSAWNSGWPGMLRLQLIPNTYPTTRASMASGTQDAFALPSADASKQTYTVGTDPSGTILTGGCAAPAPAGQPLHCEVTITGLTLTDYVLRMRAIYDPVKVIVRIFDSSNNQLNIRNAQAVVDSTGKAQDILKRLRVFVPIGTDANLPNYSLEIGDDICKRLTVIPNSPTTSDVTGVGNESCDPTVP